MLVVLLITTACKNSTTGNLTTPYHLDYPSHFPDMFIPADNPLTEEGVELGRKLYYDKKLHPNQTMSCSSCHSQQTSFSSYANNSLPHINLGFYDKFLWNGKVEGTLEDIMLFEVEEFFKTDLSILQNDPDYPDLFFKAFRSRDITSKNAAYALAQFLRTVNSYNSKYDLYLQGLATFTPEELAGYNLFFNETGDCFHCHGGALMTDNDFHNNGLDNNPDDGRFEITNDPNDIGKFKTPTLRNIALTGPYMHDGRFETLEEVVSFYSTGFNWSPTADPLIIPGAYLTAEEEQNLVAFLKTLTDESFVTNQNLSDPD
jgi:cytochrome c peroxidase